MNNMIKTLIAASTLALLQGCAGLGVGEDEFACSGLPEGTRCMSLREVYQSTHNGSVPRGEVTVADISDDSAGEDVVVRQFKDNYVAPDTPNKPVPIRTPAQVMRVLVLPYEDKSGDLVVSSYVFTEIEPRKWLYDAPAQIAPRLSPLQTLPPETGAQNRQPSAARN